MRLLSPTELDRRQLSELHDGILTAIVEYDMHCMDITSHHMLPRKLKDLIGDQAEDNDDDDHDGYRAAFSHLISHL